MYHRTPLKITHNFLFQRDIETLRESVDNFLDLLVFTPRGGFKGDYGFGFEFWSNEFQNIAIENFNQHINESGFVNRRGDPTDRGHCIKSLKRAIEMYEPRLQNVKIDLILKQKVQAEKGLHKDRKEDHTKYEVFLTIRGDLSQGAVSSEPYQKQIIFSVGPAIKQ